MSRACNWMPFYEQGLHSAAPVRAHGLYGSRRLRGRGRRVARGYVFPSAGFDGVAIVESCLTHHTAPLAISKEQTRSGHGLLFTGSITTAWIMPP